MEHLPIEILNIICQLMKHKYHMRLMMCNKHWYHQYLPFQNTINYDLVKHHSQLHLFVALRAHKVFTKNTHHLRHLQVDYYDGIILPNKLESLIIDFYNADQLRCTNQLKKLTILRMKSSKIIIPSHIQTLKIYDLPTHTNYDHLITLEITAHVFAFHKLQAPNLTSLTAHEISDSIDHLTSLTSLNVFSLALTKIPDSIITLNVDRHTLIRLPTSLTYLQMTHTSNHYQWPQTLQCVKIMGDRSNICAIKYAFVNLQSLELSNCVYAHAWPDQLVSLNLTNVKLQQKFPTSLRQLKLFQCDMPLHLAYLTKLEDLVLSTETSFICNFPSSLTNLDISCDFNYESLTQLNRFVCCTHMKFKIPFWHTTLTHLDLLHFNQRITFTWPESLTYLSLPSQTHKISFPSQLKYVSMNSYNHTLPRLPNTIKYIEMHRLTRKYKYAWPHALKYLYLDAYSHRFHYAWPDRLQEFVSESYNCTFNHPFPESLRILELPNYNKALNFPLPDKICYTNMPKLQVNKN